MNGALRAIQSGVSPNVLNEQWHGEGSGVAYTQVAYSREGRIARVRLNRPEFRNAQSRVLLEEVDAAFAQAVADPEARVIVLSGVGEAFSSGHDLGTADQQADLAVRPRGGSTEVEGAFGYSWDNFVTMSLRWRDLPKPTIAQVHGWCIFGGWLVASSMDLIVAADDARFMTALLQYFPLPYDVGPRKAKELLFDSHIIGAEEARALGFVNKVFPADELEAETTAFAERIAGNSPFYLRMAKTAVNQAQDAMGFRTAIVGNHAHYHLSQVNDLQFRRKREREEGRPETAAEAPRKRLPLVDRMLKDASEPVTD